MSGASLVYPFLDDVTAGQVHLEDLVLLGGVKQEQVLIFVVEHQPVAVSTTSNESATTPKAVQHS